MESKKAAHRHPDLISFGSGVMRSVEELQTHFSEMLGDLRREHGIDSRKTSLNGQFAELISELSAKYSQKVVILVDEHDKPILDSIEKPALAAQIRDELKNYYSVIKDSDLYEDMTAGEEIVGSFDVENIAVETLLFQTGYLTLTRFEQIGSFRRYGLSYPNLEVKSSLCNAILNHLGRDVTPEVSTNKGRIDLVLRFAGRIYLIEFKVKEQTGSGKALEQILKKGYAEQFASRAPDGKACPVYLIGVAFSSEEKNITAFEWRQLIAA